MERRRPMSRKGAQLALYIPTALRDRLAEFCRSKGEHQKGFVARAIETLLDAEGAPPAPADPSPPPPAS